MMTRLRVLVCSVTIAALLFSVVPSALAQGVLTLVEPAPSYNLSGFRYVPPQADGWRQLSVDPAGAEFVYAETADGTTINTRCQVTMRAFPVPDPTKVEGVGQLGNASRQQQYDSRRDEVLGLSSAVPLAGSDLFTYSFVVKSPVNEDERGYEDYYIGLAGDKSEYLVVQLVTRDEDFRDQVYFSYLLGSLASLHHSSDPKPEEAAASSEDVSPAPAPAAAAEQGGGHDSHEGHNHP
jgi:hypothetical protein